MGGSLCFEAMVILDAMSSDSQDAMQQMWKKLFEVRSTDDSASIAYYFFGMKPFLKDDAGKGTKQTGEVHQYAALDNKFDWGVAGGLGAYCRTKNAGLYQLEVRLNYSFGTLFASKSSDYFSQSNPMCLSINFAWMWEIKNVKPKTISKK